MLCLHLLYTTMYKAAVEQWHWTEFRKHGLDDTWKHKLFRHDSYLTVWNDINTDVLNTSLTIKRHFYLHYILHFSLQFASSDIQPAHFQLEEISMALWCPVYNNNIMNYPGNKIHPQGNAASALIFLFSCFLFQRVKLFSGCDSSLHVWIMIMELRYIIHVIDILCWNFRVSVCSNHSYMKCVLGSLPTWALPRVSLLLEDHHMSVLIVVNR